MKKLSKYILPVWSIVMGVLSIFCQYIGSETASINCMLACIFVALVLEIRRNKISNININMDAEYIHDAISKKALEIHAEYIKNEYQKTKNNEETTNTK